MKNEDKQVTINEADIENTQARTRLLNAQAHELEIKNKKAEKEQ